MNLLSGDTIRLIIRPLLYKSRIGMDSLILISLHEIDKLCHPDAARFGPFLN